MNDIRLLITDLDGTLLGRKDEHENYRQLHAKIAELRMRYNTAWAISSGRSISSFRKVFKPLTAEGISPDYVIAKHAYIYSLEKWGCLPHLIWNTRITRHIWTHSAMSGKAMRDCKKAIMGKFRRVELTCDRSDRLCLRFKNTDTIEPALQLVKKMTARNRDLQVFQFMNVLEIRSVPFTKGLAASELSHQLSIPREEILAIGDGLNDISMLNGSVAGMTACPANANTEVVQAVHNNHGGCPWPV